MRRREDTILIPDLIGGNLYRIRSRNLGIGVWSPESNGFWGIRRKFTNTFCDHEYHYDYDDPQNGINFSTACPYEDLKESSAEIPNFITQPSKQFFEWLLEAEKRHKVEPQ